MPAGRPRKELDAEQVYKLARIGCTQAEIADIFNVNEATIRRNYAEEYRRAQGDYKTSIKRAQFLRVKKGSDTMLVHLGKTVLGQTEKATDGQSEVRVIFERRGRNAGGPGGIAPDAEPGEESGEEI
jgi:hypothetical protein